MRRGGSPYNALSEGCSLGRADPPQEDEGMGGQYRDGDAGGDRGTARQTAGGGAQGSRGQEGAAGRGCGCEGRPGTSVQKVRPPGAVVLQVDPQSAAERAGLKPGDLVTELDGTPVRDAADLQLGLALLRIGEVAEFAVSRDGGAATGFATALAELALREGRQAVWIRSDFAAAEAGELYGPGLALMGLSLRRLIVLRVPRPRDALWAMEEALQCRAAGAG